MSKVSEFWYFHILLMLIEMDSNAEMLIATAEIFQKLSSCIYILARVINSVLLKPLINRHLILNQLYVVARELTRELMRANARELHPLVAFLNVA
jgi:hypothetical protein